ncbi:hypothetical protein BX264_5439 [Streptomyces sp. 2333.5]|nr:hypothetical protein BX264_5439 [Streptomyces sp. 2333.5]SEE65622.1 hypothetical protein SAMN05428943_5540 [Streptomyces sp. 2314.4]SEE92155.1 hypothetical protein SAMN05428942_5538 [Streptomyces sp. 2112.2]
MIWLRAGKIYRLSDSTRTLPGLPGVLILSPHVQ